jgi:uncharacterized secreted protein with C-terminal beta-propeller domain
LGYAPDSVALAAGAQPDLVKTDGSNYVYALEHNDLVIMKVSPAKETAVISRVTFKSRPQAMFLSGNFLAVYGTDTQIAQSVEAASFKRTNPYTFFKVFDVSDPLNPKPVRDLDFEGSFSAARLVGNYVYFLTSLPGVYLSAEPVLPRVLDNGQVLGTQCDGATECFAPEVYYVDAPYGSYRFASVAAINIINNTETLSGQTYLLNNYQDVYLGDSSLYLVSVPTVDTEAVTQAVTKSVVYPKLPATTQGEITTLAAAASSVLNNYEKSAKITGLINSYLSALSTSDQTAIQSAVSAALPAALAAAATADTGNTFIYKIGLSGNQFAYQAQGEVTGQILGRSASDENGDYLRLVTASAATASSSAVATDFYSNIYVLGPDLKTVGSLNNLDTTSQISSSRFIGNRVYLIPGTAADPLVAIDLSDPTKPAVLGALQLSGLTAYLQPLDQNGQTFVSLGWDNSATSTDGTAISNLKLSLFDFTDLSQPKELGSYLIGDALSNSIALTDHSALFYSPDKNLLTVPAAWRDSKGNLTFAGDLVFATSNNKLNLEGKIDHSAGGHFSQSDSWLGQDYYDNTVKRSFLLADNLATFSNKFLKLNNSASLQAVASLELTAAGDDYMITSSTANCATPSASSTSETSAPTSPNSSSPPATSTPNTTP